MIVFSNLGPMQSPLLETIRAQKRGQAAGIYSICSANRFVLEASMLQAKKDGSAILIESTSNQVDQYGGYTGMTPSDFVAYVKEVADSVDFPFPNVILGGDHLGPNAWQKEIANAAMEKAHGLMHAYMLAGFQKIHLDASMPCANDPIDEHSALPVHLTIERTAELCSVCEEVHASNSHLHPPLYVIGTEVPIPGGAKEELEELQVTRVEAAKATVELTREAFLSKGLQSAWRRVIAVVVQPGVEFGDFNIMEYDRAKTKGLSELIKNYDNLVYEAHSTDYQSKHALRGMVKDGFAILKVGPWLTFAFREAVFALANIEREWLSDRKSVDPSGFYEVIDSAMRSNPQYWQGYYEGDETELAYARKYSYSDRIRYYWPVPEVADALKKLLSNVGNSPIPTSLLSQYMPIQYQALKAGRISNNPIDLIHHKIMEVTEIYSYAVGSAGESSN